MGITFTNLRNTGRYAFASFRGTPVVVHDDDRWMRPVVAAACTVGLATAPTLLVSLDRDHDACDPLRGIDALTRLRSDELPTAALLHSVDRLLHNNHVLNIKGRSYRLRDLERAVTQLTT